MFYVWISDFILFPIYFWDGWDGQEQTYENLLQWGGALMELSVYEDADAARERLAGNTKP